MGKDACSAFIELPRRINSPPTVTPLDISGSARDAVKPTPLHTKRDQASCYSSGWKRCVAVNRPISSCTKMLPWRRRD